MTHKSRIIQLTQQLGEETDRREAAEAELAKVKQELSTLVDWIMGDAGALEVLQRVYLNPDTSEANRIKAAASALPFEKPRLSATATVTIDFREKVRQARLWADARLLEQGAPKTIEHRPEPPLPESA